LLPLGLVSRGPQLQVEVCDENGGEF